MGLLQGSFDGADAAAPILWPQSFARVFDDVLPVHIISQILDHANTVASWPNMWTPRVGQSSSSEDNTSPIAQCVRHLETHVLADILPRDCTGVEWWVQVYEPGNGLAFHFDKDEQLFKKSGRMSHPLLSSVLYLVGDTGGTPLGATVVVDQQFDSASNSPQPSCPPRSALLFPRANRLALFDGRLGHGVLDSPSPAPRVTLLLNWWRERPQGVEVPPANLLASCGWGPCPQTLGISKAPHLQTSRKPLPAASPCNSPCSSCRPSIRDPPDSALELSDEATPLCAVCQTQSASRETCAQLQMDAHTAEEANGEATDFAEGCTSRKAGGCFCCRFGQPGVAQPGLEQSGAGHPGFRKPQSGESGSGQPGSEQRGSGQLGFGRPGFAQPGSGHTRARVALLSVPSPDAAGECHVMTVDDLLECYKVELSGNGPNVVAAVAIEHPGCQLYPLLAEEQGAQFASLTVAAALVPNFMMEEEEDSADDDDNDASTDTDC